MKGQTVEMQVYNMSLNQNQIQSIYHTDEPSNSKNGYTAIYNAGDISGTVTDVFSSALTATTSWMSLCVMLAVVGVVLAFLMGILFKISRIMGMG